MEGTLFSCQTVVLECSREGGSVRTHRNVARDTYSGIRHRSNQSDTGTCTSLHPFCKCHRFCTVSFCMGRTLWPQQLKISNARTCFILTNIIHERTVNYIWETTQSTARASYSLLLLLLSKHVMCIVRPW